MAESLQEPHAVAVSRLPIGECSLKVATANQFSENSPTWSDMDVILTLELIHHRVLP
jgi:hypothetical protein